MSNLLYRSHHCDGMVPVCSTCVELGTVCTYSEMCGRANARSRESVFGARHLTPRAMGPTPNATIVIPRMIANTRRQTPIYQQTTGTSCACTRYLASATGPFLLGFSAPAMASLVYTCMGASNFATHLAPIPSIIGSASNCLIRMAYMRSRSTSLPVSILTTILCFHVSSFKGFMASA